MSKERRCKDRVREEWKSRREALEAIMDSEDKGEEHKDYGPFNEYGLCFDYVPTGTWKDDPEAYWRYQMSWGGPSDEIRFYSSDGKTCYKIEYWFLDWFDGAHLDIKREKIAQRVWDWLVGAGSVEYAKEKELHNEH